jgi:threonine/homoserine/homoserine lactone efflux protein
MPGASELVLFATASLALLVVPGPAVVYIVSRSLEQGRAAGAASMLGVHAGSVVHVAAAAAGVSAVLATSATAFALVRYLGAAYLVYLGVQRLRRGRSAPPDQPIREPRARLFRRGFVVNVLNPKTALFFLAFLPQFVDPARGAVALQVALLGLCFIVLGVLSDGAYALAAGGLGERLRRSAAVRRRLDRLSGGVYLGLGAAAALSTERPRGV